MKKKSKNHVSPDLKNENVTHSVSYGRAVAAKRAQTKLEEVADVLRSKLNDSNKKNMGLQEAIDGLNKEIKNLNGIIGDDKFQIERLQRIVEDISKKQVLTFDSLRCGGTLEKYVNDISNNIFAANF